MYKVQDVGPCQYAILNSMDQNAYIQLTTDHPQQTVAFYSVLQNFMVPGQQYFSPVMTLIPAGQTVQLDSNTHYMFGVVNLLAGVTYSLTFWRDPTEYS